MDGSNREVPCFWTIQMIWEVIIKNKQGLNLCLLIYWQRLFTILSVEDTFILGEKRYWRTAHWFFLSIAAKTPTDFADFVDSDHHHWAWCIVFASKYPYYLTLYYPLCNRNMSPPNGSVSSLRIVGVEEASFTSSLPNINIDSKNAAISRRVYVTLPSLDECCECLHLPKFSMVWDAIP